MFQFFRTGVGRWLAIAIVGFAAFGLLFFGNMQFGVVGGASAVASVGEYEVSVERFQREYQERLRSSGLAQLGLEQAAALGFHTFVLQDMLLRGAVLDEAAQIGLMGPDAAVARAIAGNPNFRSSDGGFNRQAYDEFLRSIRLRAPDYEERVREQLTEAIVLGAVRGGATVSPALAEMIWRRDAERRDIAFVTLSARDEDAQATPTDEQIQAFYEANPAAFTTPEFRVVALYWMRPEDRLDQVSIDESAVAELYQQRLASYTREERRRVARLIYADAEAAEAAANRLRQAPVEDREALLAELATEAGIEGGPTSLGLITRSDAALFGEEAAAAIFEGDAEAATGSIVGPITAPTGAAIYRIVSVSPEEVTPFERVSEALRREIAVEEARRGLAEVQIQIEDLRAGGSTLAQIQEQMGGQYSEIVMDAQGRDPEGAPHSNLPNRTRVLALVFPTDPVQQQQIVGLEREFEAAENNAGFFTVQVLETRPAQLRPLEEARDDVIAAWRRQQATEALERRTAEIAARIEAGEDFAAVAEAEGLEISSQTGLRRNQTVQGVPQTALAELFAPTAEVGAVRQVAVDAAAASETGGEAGQARRVIVRLSAITTPEPSENETALTEMRRRLDTLIANELQLSFTNAAFASREVSVNQGILTAAVTARQGSHGG